MGTRLIGPAAGILLGTAGAWAFLNWNDLVVAWIPTGLVSGSYNTILLLEAGCFAVLLLRLLGRGRRSLAVGEGALSAGPGDVVRPLAVVAAALVWINAFDYLLKRAVEYEYRRVMPLLALEMEGNLPTLFSTCLLLLSALLVALVWRLTPVRERGRPAWLGLAAVLAFLALDEFAELHERLVPLGRSLLAGRGLFGREWILAYALFAIPVGVLVLWFLRQVPRRTRYQFLVAGVVFLAGAVGLELLAGRYDPRAGELTPIAALLNIAKEGCEMAGSLIFLYGLLELLELKIGRFAIVSSSTPGSGGGRITNR